MYSPTGAQELCRKIGRDIYRGEADASTLASVRSLLLILTRNTELRSRLFRHPLGFIDFPASQIFELPWKARLHIWRDAEKGAAHSNIHCHNSDVASFVAAGSLKDIQYEVIESSPTHAHYNVEYSAIASKRVRTERRYSLRPRSERIYASGAVYIVPAFTFHQTIISPVMWPVTFMISYNEAASPAVALGPLTGPSVIDYPHVSDLSELETKELLEQSVELLDQARQIGSTN
ncbi:hypothetical protein [Bradyrhizobium sp.]